MKKDPKISYRGKNNFCVPANALLFGISKFLAVSCRRTNFLSFLKLVSYQRTRKTKRYTNR